MDAQLIRYLDLLHQKDQYLEIVKVITNIPREQMPYELVGHLARAYNNLDFYDEAIKLLDACKEQGLNDPLWHFRKAYAHYYKEELQLARESFAEAARLDPKDQDAVLFLKAIQDEENKNNNAPAPNSQMVVAQLNARLQPDHRGYYFEDPLEKFLQETDMGHVSGGGTMLSDKREVAYCDIEVTLNNPTGEAILLLMATFDRLNAPKGSKLKVGADKEYEFGKTEGLGLYLNGTELPDAVYQNNDVNDVFTNIEKLIEGKGSIMSYWESSSETAFYLYGDSFEILKNSIAEFISQHPLCQKCRIEQIA